MAVENFQVQLQPDNKTVAFLHVHSEKEIE